jgi:hypothetical protein
MLRIRLLDCSGHCFGDSNSSATRESDSIGSDYRT